ncbi:hypothetical protein FACS189475_02260 [Betaproteobacteria bacterium]|nr:hypothetical protein FACS189475_02260 [Betaproteobacteria bacterium]
MKSDKKIASDQSTFEAVAEFFCADGGEGFIKFVTFIVLIWLWIDTGSFFVALLLSIFIGPLSALVIAFSIIFLTAFFTIVGWIFRLFLGSRRV